MTIDHLIVSWIQVGGLAVSLYGLFYLSFGLFPREGISWLRPLLPAGAAGLLGYIFGQLVEQFPESIGFKFPLPSWILGLISFAIGYFISFQAQFGKESTSNWPLRALRERLTGISAVLVLLLTGLITGLFELLGRALFERTPSRFIALQVVLVCLFELGLAIPIFLSPRLSKSTLQTLGFIFSVIGIFAGFLPAILDVIGITVK